MEGGGKRLEVQKHRAAAGQKETDKTIPFGEQKEKKGSI